MFGSYVFWNVAGKVHGSFACAGKLPDGVKDQSHLVVRYPLRFFAVALDGIRVVERSSIC